MYALFITRRVLLIPLFSSKKIFKVPYVLVKDFFDARVSFCVRVAVPVSVRPPLLAESWEAHHHTDSHQGDECGVEFHDRHREAVCELLHAYYFRINHRAGAVYGWFL